MSGIPIPTGDREKDKEYWGDYRRPGDVHKSSCHTCCCAVVFLAILGAMIAIFLVGHSTGRPWAIIKSWDNTGNYCGYNNTKLRDIIIGIEDSDLVLRDFTDFPYLFMSPQGVLDSNQLCVAKCPTDSDGDYESALSDSCPNEKRICPAYLTEEEAAAERKKGGKCVCPYPTLNVLNRCVPRLDADVAGNIAGNVTDLFNAFKGVLLSIPGLGDGVISCATHWREILVFAVCSLVVAFIWIFLLRCMAGCIVYIVVILVPLLIAALGVGFFLYGKSVFSFDDEKVNKIVAYVLWAVAALILLIIIFLWKSLKTAVQVIKISARALGSNFTALFAPLISIILGLVFWAAVIVSCVYNYTGADFLVVTKDNGDVLSFDLNKTLQYFLIFNLVFLVYISVHIYFTNYYAQSSAFVDWYFGNKQKMCCCNFRCLYGFWLACTKGLGLITVTSLIMTPLYIFIIFMEYLDRKAKADQTSVGFLWRCIIKCMKCCLWCFEKIMKYLNKVLLTMSQIYNTGWCKSAQLTMSVLMKDLILVFIVNGVSTFILFLSKVVCGVITSVGFFLYLRFYVKDTTSWWLPVLCVFILSYIISGFFINMFDSIIDIIFVCYQSDNDLTNSGTIRPLFISDDMQGMITDLKQSSAPNARVEAASDPGDSAPQTPEVSHRHRRRRHA